MKKPQKSAEEIFSKALTLVEPNQRRAYLLRECAGDADLLEEIESLVGAHKEAGTFMGRLPQPADPIKPQLPEVGRVFGEYDLIEEIARGGMGVVYKARHQPLNRVVALKMILGGRLASRSEVERFRSEAKATASLHHPNIVGIYEVGEVEGRPFYSMPFLEGASLGQLVESDDWDSGDGGSAARIMVKVARAIQHAHEHGILHRDLKPGNIFLDKHGEPQVMDFGLAKQFQVKGGVTLTGEVLGSPSFMAPEQAAGRSKEVTMASDVYGLGAVLYYLLTGRPPFVSESPLVAMLMALEGKAANPRTLNPRIPVELERICLQCLEKSPGRRYASAADLAKDLEHFINGEPIAFPEQSLRHQVRGWMHTNPGMVLRLLGLAASALVSEMSFQLRDIAVNPALGEKAYVLSHYGVIGVMLFWMLASWGCHAVMAKPRWADRMLFAWAALDVASLTAILALDRAVESGLLALYPVLIALSGLWMRVQIVALTTALVAWGYVALMAIYGPRNLTDPPHWPFIVLVVLCLEGLCVAYMVHRIRQLSDNRDRSWLA